MYAGYGIQNLNASRAWWGIVERTRWLISSRVERAVSYREIMDLLRARGCAHWLSNVTSCLSFESATKMASNFAGSVALAFSLSV